MDDETAVMYDHILTERIIIDIKDTLDEIDNYNVMFFKLFTEVTDINFQKEYAVQLKTGIQDRIVFLNKLISIINYRNSKNEVI
jgi:hypothetical protein